MPDIMQKNCQQCGLILLIRYVSILVAQRVQCLLHEVHGSQGMLETGMLSARIDQMGQTQLPDIPQPLKIRMLYHIKYQIVGDCYKSIYRIIDYFPLVHWSLLF